MNTVKITYKPFTSDDFGGVMALGNDVHGDNYLDHDKTQYYYDSGFKNGINASFVAYHQNKLVGFRLTQAAMQWEIDEWCSPERWQLQADQVCYFKSNTVNAEYRGHGIGSTLLMLSIEQAKLQGAKAGLAHIWMASPGNSAFKYFKKCGGELIKEHPKRWAGWHDSHGYLCPVCGKDCHCTAAEMMIRFTESPTN